MCYAALGGMVTPAPTAILDLPMGKKYEARKQENKKAHHGLS